MAKRLSKRTRASRSRIIKKKDIGLHLPSAPEIVKAIAMQGVTDDELAFMFGLPPKTIEGWRKMYDSFDSALEEGRTVADLEVVEALHKKATGYSYEKEFSTKEGKVRSFTQHVEPETNAIKFWLQNRTPEQWNRAAKHLQLTGKKGEPNLDGVTPESKLELMSSILSLIQPKPDGA
jgi:hypothetical protein